MAKSKTTKRGPKGFSSDPKQRMKELRERGLMTPEHGHLGGRPKKSATDTQRPKRAGTAVAEAAAENADKIAEVFASTLTSDELSDRQKVQALKVWLGVERVETDRERDERGDPANAERFEIANREDAERALSEALGNPIIRNRLSALLAAAPPDQG